MIPEADVIMIVMGGDSCDVGEDDEYGGGL